MYLRKSKIFKYCQTTNFVEIIENKKKLNHFCEMAAKPLLLFRIEKVFTGILYPEQTVCKISAVLANSFSN